MVNDSWRVASIRRFGRLAFERIYPDSALMRLCTKVESRNAIAFSATGCPDFKAHWATILDGLDYTLLGNRSWRLGVSHYLQDVASASPTATVTINVYNPMNTVVHLHQFAKTEDMNYLPVMTVKVDTGTSVRTLFGWLCWDGTSPPSPTTTIDEVFGGTTEFLLSQTIHCAWEYEEQVCRRYGLSYRLFEVVDSGNPEPDCRELVSNETACTWGGANRPDLSFIRFLVEVRPHCRVLAEYLSTFSNL